jgi:acetylornithine deacetylase
MSASPVQTPQEQDPGAGSIRRRVTHAVAADRESLLEFLAESVRRPSISGREDDVAAFYRDWCVDQGWNVDVQPLSTSSLGGALTDEPRPAERTNLVVRTGHGSGGRDTLVINGHVDVVPPGEDAQWTHPPFSGRRRGGRVHGRGSVDTKGGIAAALFACKALDATGIRLSWDIALALVVGEETTGIGTQASFDLLPEPAAAIVLEPTGNDVVPICSGLLFFTIETFGVAAHTSAPWQGQDALVLLLDIRRALAELADVRSAAYSHPLLDDLPTAIPFVVGTMQAGTFRASVPDHATMSGRFGIPPGESISHVRELVEEIVDRLGRDAVRPPRVRWGNSGSAGWETPLDAPLVTAMQRAHGDVIGGPALRGMTSGSDASFYGGRGVPTVLFGPGDMAAAHAPDESVEEDAVVSAATVLALTMLGMDEAAGVR